MKRLLVIFAFSAVLIGCQSQEEKLLNAPYWGDCRRVKSLMENGADVNCMDPFSQTPLHKAAAWGKYDVAELLIGKGANLNAQDLQGKTPLFLAIWSPVVKKRRYPASNIFPDRSGQQRIVKLLVEKGADVNIKDIYGDAPLHRAVQYSSLSTVKYLIEKGARVQARNKSNDTPLHTAVHHNYSHVVAKHLIEKGADVNSKNRFGNSPLHLIALRHGFNENLVRLLLMKGADTEAKNKEGYTPLELLKKYRSPALFEKAKKIFLQERKGTNPVR
jgi:ankyrin repeat protein